MEELSNDRNRELEVLKVSIEKMKKEKSPACRFGLFCQRRFCKFDHSYLYYKVNKNQNQEAIENKECNVCTKPFNKKEDFKRHVRLHHNRGNYMTQIQVHNQENDIEPNESENESESDLDDTDADDFSEDSTTEESSDCESGEVSP